MIQSLLDAVTERLDARIDECRSSTVLEYIGVWLGVIDTGHTWTTPPGLMQYNAVCEAAIVWAATGDEDARAYFVHGVEWLRQRTFFRPGTPRTLEGDAFGCLALAIGVSCMCDPDTQEWVVDFLQRVLAIESVSPLNVDAVRLGLALVSPGGGAEETLPPLVLVACSPMLGCVPGTEQRSAALDTVLSEIGPQADWALFHRAALRRLLAAAGRIDLAATTTDHVVQVLERIPAALKRWPWEKEPKTRKRSVTAQRWDVQHEYHVQSLLWTVLRPIFPALEDEENLQSVGHKHPRADLLIQNLQLVIEVKYLREATQSARAKLIEEIAADVSLYFVEGSGYERMIVFIWDASRATNHHAEIKAGVGKLGRVESTVIFSRPGDWE